MRWRRLLLLAVIASLAVTAALAIGILLLGDFDDTEWRVLGTTFAISVASLLALPGAQLLDQRRAAPLAWATVALAAVAFVLFEQVLWTDEDGETAWKRVGTAAVFAVATTQIAALTSRLKAGDRQSVGVLYLVTFGLVLLLAALATTAIWKEIDSDTFYRVLAALAVLNVFLVVLQPLLRRLGGASGKLPRQVRPRPGWIQGARVVRSRLRRGSCGRGSPPGARRPESRPRRAPGLSYIQVGCARSKTGRRFTVGASARAARSTALTTRSSPPVAATSLAMRGSLETFSVACVTYALEPSPMATSPRDPRIRASGPRWDEMSTTKTAAAARPKTTKPCRWEKSEPEYSTAGPGSANLRWIASGRNAEAATQIAPTKAIMFPARRA